MIRSIRWLEYIQKHGTGPENDLLENDNRVNEDDKRDIIERSKFDKSTERSE